MKCVCWLEHLLGNAVLYAFRYILAQTWPKPQAGNIIGFPQPLRVSFLSTTPTTVSPTAATQVSTINGGQRTTGSHNLPCPGRTFVLTGLGVGREHHKFPRFYTKAQQFYKNVCLDCCMPLINFHITCMVVFVSFVHLPVLFSVGRTSTNLSLVEPKSLVFI